MERISRRQIVRGAAVAAAATLGAPSVRAQKNQQILRFVAEADLRVLDPVWTTAYITRNHGYLVYDTLFGTDENLQIRPQMVCQSAFNIDPVSASNFDPFERRALAVALASLELAGIAETRRARVM
jgi:hypothetical protein